jgi:hypothetical protein
METVFPDVPFVADPKNWSKITHVAGKVYSQLTLSRNLALIDLSAVPLRKLGISRKDLIDCDGSQYPETRGRKARPCYFDGQNCPRAEIVGRWLKTLLWFSVVVGPPDMHGRSVSSQDWPKPVSI